MIFNGLIFINILEKILVTYHKERLIITINSYNSLRNIPDLSTVLNDNCIISSRNIQANQINKLKYKYFHHDQNNQLALLLKKKVLLKVKLGRPFLEIF
jgi:hypothetical protein